MFNKRFLVLLALPWYQIAFAALKTLFPRNALMYTNEGNFKRGQNVAERFKHLSGNFPLGISEFSFCLFLFMFHHGVSFVSVSDIDAVSGIRLQRMFCETVALEMRHPNTFSELPVTEIGSFFFLLFSAFGYRKLPVKKKNETNVVQQRVRT